jgi:hypothetical protein
MPRMEDPYFLARLPPVASYLHWCSLQQHSPSIPASDRASCVDALALLQSRPCSTLELRFSRVSHSEVHVRVALAPTANQIASSGRKPHSVDRQDTDLRKTQEPTSNGRHSTSIRKPRKGSIPATFEAGSRSAGARQVNAVIEGPRLRSFKDIRAVVRPQWYRVKPESARVFVSLDSLPRGCGQ